MLGLLAFILISWNHPTSGPRPDGYKLLVGSQVIDVGYVNMVGVDVDPTMLTTISVVSYNEFGQSPPSPAQYVGIAQCPDKKSGINVDDIPNTCQLLDNTKKLYSDQIIETKRWQTAATHPNGQLYSDHWQACGQTVKVQQVAITAQDARIKRILSKCGNKCKGM